MSGATIHLSLQDYRDWPRATTRNQVQLAIRAIDAAERHEPTVWLSRWNFARWIKGDFCPWLRPDVRYETQDGVNWPVLDS